MLIQIFRRRSLECILSWAEERERRKKDASCPQVRRALLLSVSLSLSDSTAADTFKRSCFCSAQSRSLQKGGFLLSQNLALATSPPVAPAVQCKTKFSYVFCYKQLDGSLSDGLLEESLVLLLRASWRADRGALCRVTAMDTPCLARSPRFAVVATVRGLQVLKWEYATSSS